MKLAALASCREAVGHHNPDSLAGHSYTARNSWQRTGDTPGTAGKGGNGNGVGATSSRRCLHLFTDYSRTSQESEKSVRGSESKLSASCEVLFYSTKAPWCFESKCEASPCRRHTTNVRSLNRAFKLRPQIVKGLWVTRTNS